MIGSFSLDMIRKKHAWQTVFFLWKIESRHVLPVYEKFWLYCSVTLKRPLLYIRRIEPAYYVIFKRGGREKCKSEREPFTLSLNSRPERFECYGTLVFLVTQLEKVVWLRLSRKAQREGFVLAVERGGAFRMNVCSCSIIWAFFVFVTPLYENLCQFDRFSYLAR